MLQEKRFLLIKNLNQLVTKYGNNNQVRIYITENLQKKNILASYGTRILGKKIQLETFDFDNEENLFIIYEFVKYFQGALLLDDRITGNRLGTQEELDNLNLFKYFTMPEIQKFKDIKQLPQKQESKYPYEFDNMIKVSDGHYIGVITAQRLAKIDNANDIQYNFNIQRDPKIDVFGMKKININQQKIKEIKNNILQGTQFSDEIKINVLRDGEDNVEFKSSNGIIGKLIIHSGVMNIFDGYHRKTANTLALLDNPELNFNWKFTITNYTENKARDFMVQVNKQTPMKKEYIKNINPNLIENVVVDYINDDNSSVMYNQIKESINELKFGGLTRKSILATAIKETFGSKLNKLNAKKIANYIADKMNIIAENINIDNYSVNPNMFYLYIALINSAYTKQISEDNLENILLKINFYNDNELWDEIGITNNDLNKMSRMKLYNLANQVCFEGSK